METKESLFRTMYEKEIEMRNNCSWDTQTSACFDEFGEVSAQFYFKIARTCKEKGIKKIYDIGCAVPFQAKIFNHYGIDYVGIDNDASSFVGWAQDNYINHAVRNYPFPIQAEKNTAIVTSYCLGYFSRGEETYEQMKKDFRYFCGFIGTGSEFNKFRTRFAVTDSISTELPLCFADREAKENPEAIETMLKIYHHLDHPFHIEFKPPERHSKNLKTF
jgi:hypothetical protein